MKGFECEEFLGFWQPSKTTCLLCCWAAAELPLAVYTGALAAPRCSVLMSGLETLLCLCSITGVWSRRWTDTLLLRLSSNCGFHLGKVSAGVAESAQMRPRTCGNSQLEKLEEKNWEETQNFSPLQFVWIVVFLLTRRCLESVCCWLSLLSLFLDAALWRVSSTVDLDLHVQVKPGCCSFEVW